MTDRRRPRPRAQCFFQCLVRGIVEALLAEGLAAADTQDCRGVVLVLHPLSQLDHIVPALGLGVQLGKRDG